MKNTSPDVDAYIEDAAPFAQPILKKVRRVMHKACPTIEETIKWRTPCFEQQGIVAGLSAFKQHVRFAFWKGTLLKDPKGLLDPMGTCGVGAIVWKDVKEMPADAILIRYVKEAVKLNEAGVTFDKSERTKKRAKKLAVPDHLMQALKKNKKALATFDGFSPSHRKEYVEWVTEAKREATREKRLATAIEWMAEGKPRNWKYMKKW